MFTGIILAQGLVTKTTPLGQGLSIQVETQQTNLDNVAIGDSVAVNGVCLTVTGIDYKKFSFDVSAETLNKTLIEKWQQSESVNLETALTLETPLGGHLLSGHVDGFAKLESIENDQNNFAVLTFSVDKTIGKYLAVKGSVALNGISLTTNQIEDVNKRTLFSLTIVPHTLTHTNLGDLINQNNVGQNIGTQVHIEVDQIARYVHRLMTVEA